MDSGGFVLFDSKLFFAANDGTHGSELWSTDGTEEGTALFKDISPGAYSSFPVCASHVHALTASTQPSPGLPVPPTVRAARGRAQSTFAVMNGNLFFKAYTSAAGYELWKCDGTEAGTVMAVNIDEGTGNGFPVRRNHAA